MPRLTNQQVLLVNAVNDGVQLLDEPIAHATGKNAEGIDEATVRTISEELEQMLEDEMSNHLGDERYEAKRRNSGNSRNEGYGKKVRTSMGESTLQMPKDRQWTFEPQILKR